MARPSAAPSRRASPRVRWHRLAIALSLLLLGLIHAASPAGAADDPRPTAPRGTPEGAATPTSPSDDPGAPANTPRPRDPDAASTPSASAPAPGGGVPVAVPASRQMTNAAIVTISGEINAVTASSFERRVNAAINGGADGIIVELDTPGGAVGAVLEITKFIKGLSVPVIAWVHSEAISGGAIIAIACNSIVTSRNGVMGDAAPIDPIRMMMGEGLDPSERAKILSPLLSEVIDSARRNGHDEMLVQSFVMLGVQTWMVEDVQTGQRYFLTRAEYEALFDEEPAAVSPLMPGIGGNQGAGALTVTEPRDIPSEDESVDGGEEPAGAPRPAGGPLKNEADPFSPATDLPSDLVESVSIALVVDSTRPDFTRADPARYRLVRYATDGTALLTLGAQDLQETRLVDPTVFINDREEMKRYVGATNVRVLDQTWSERIVSFMTQGFSGIIIRAVLIVTFLLGLFIELAMPGIGVAGVIALIALLGLVVPPLLINAAMWWTIAAILIGIALLLMEIFVLPGFGIPGISGVLLVLTGIVGTFAGTGELFPGAGTGTDSSLAGSLAVVLLSLFAAGVGMYLFTRYTKIVPFVNLLVLSDTGRAPDTNAPSVLEAMGSAGAAHATLRIAQVGVATTPLRPSGTAEFDETLHDVIASYGMIDTGTAVRIVSINGNRVVVEPADAGASPGGAPLEGTPPIGDPGDPDGNSDGEGETEPIPHA